MGVVDTLRRWAASAATAPTTFQCVDCGAQFTSDEGDCPECGGPVESYARPVEFRYWGPQP